MSTVLYYKPPHTELHTAREAYEGSCLAALRIAHHASDPSSPGSVQDWLDSTQAVANCMLVVFDQLPPAQQQLALIQLGWRPVFQPTPQLKDS